MSDDFADVDSVTVWRESSDSEEQVEVYDRFQCDVVTPLQLDFKHGTFAALKQTPPLLIIVPIVSMNPSKLP